MSYTRKVRYLVTVVVVFTIALLAGCGTKPENNTNADVTVPVTVSEAQNESIAAKTVISGKVTPLSEVMIMPKIAGKVSQVPVDMGARVKKGQLLVKIDTADLEINLSAALTGLQNAKLTHNQAVLNYNNAKSNYERMQAMFNEGAISQQQLEQAELAYNLAKDGMNAPVEANAQNQIDTIRNHIANATMTSPVDGEVATRNIEPGEMAGPSQPVMTVVNIDKILVEGTVAESDIALVKQGQKVTVKVEAAGGNFEGIVKILSPVANSQTKGYPVKIEIDNSGRKLKPGMFAEIELVTKSKEAALVIPKEALVTRGADKILYVVQGGIAIERPVETGIEANDKVEIIKGLSTGEKFVLGGQQSLFDKVKVKVQGE